MKEKIVEFLVKAIPAKDLSKEEIEQTIEIPPEFAMGDFAFPCFKLAGKMKKSPKVIAEELKAKIDSMKSKELKETKVVGAYLNFYLNYDFLAEKLVPKILKEKQKFGSNSKGKKQKIMIEYSAPNTNKPLTLGHLRNDSIGMSLVKLSEANDFKVVKANLFSDRGVHICKAMLAYKKWGNGKKPDKKPDHFVGDYYVMFAQKAKENPELENEALQMLVEWEKGNKEVIALWKKLQEWVIEGFNQTYKKFGSSFDVIFKESNFFGKSKPLIELGLKKKVFIKEESGAVMADLEKFGLSRKTILRADGSSIYITNDLALTKTKFEKFKLKKAFWIVGNEQNLYFKQLFKVLELMGFSWAKNCFHVNYGMVFLPEGVMKSREGNVVDADDLMNELIAKAKEEIKQRHPEISEKELNNRAEIIGLGAIKFYLLKTDASKDMVFDPKESISFEGETAPFIQYAFVRCNSILEKAKADFNKADFSLLKEPKEKKLLNLLMKFPSVVEKSNDSLSPHVLCQFLLELASDFNSFYKDIPVLKAEKNLLQARLALVKAVAQTIENGLNLLNIGVPEKM